MRVFLLSAVAFALFLAVAFTAVTILVGYLFPRSPPIPPEPEDLFATVGEVKIRYRTVGDGEETILFLHGFGGRLESWLSTAQNLSCGRAVVIDLPGFGGSDRPDASFDLESQRVRLIGLLDVLGIERAVLVGVSMGGSLAAWTAAHAPERVTALALFAPSGFPGSLQYGRLRNFFQRPGLGNRVASTVTRFPFFSRIFPHSLARQAVDVAGSYSPSFAESLRRIESPTLVVWSAGDQRVPISYAKEWFASIRNVTFTEVPPEAGHSLPDYKPAERAESICRFLNQGSDAGEAH